MVEHDILKTGQNDRSRYPFYRPIYGFFVQAWQYDLMQQAIKSAYAGYVRLIADAIHDGIEQGNFQPTDSLAVSRAAGSIDGMIFQLLADAEIGFRSLLDLLAGLVVRGLAKGENDHA